MSTTSQFCKKGRLLVVHNPVAGRSERRRMKAALKALRAEGFLVDVHVSRFAGDAEVFAKDSLLADPGYAAIIAAGGDGTLNEVLNGIAGSGMPVGLFPMGSANVFALEHHIPKDPQAWVRMIAAGHTENLHLGRANGRCFVAMVSAGYDSRAVAGVNLRLKRMVGKAAYALSGLLALVRSAGERFRVTVDGKSFEAGWAVVSKTRAFGGPFEVVPTADGASPALGVAIFPVRGILGRVWDLLEIGRGHVGRIKGAHFLTGNTVTLEGGEGLPSQMDGDPYAPLPVYLEPGPAVPFLLSPDCVQKSTGQEKNHAEIP